MPDSMDAEQERLLQQQEDALARFERARGRQTGLPECVHCAEAISALRQGMGARLCVECQTDQERRDRGIARVAK
jgi:RNA polymerase-binding transcription factor DksA